MTDDLDQGRLQEFGVDTSVSPVDDPEPRCDRCSDDLDGEAGRSQNPLPTPHEAPVDDLYLTDDVERQLCANCRLLEQYLQHRYDQLTEKPWIDGAVAVFCRCHGESEVDVQPVGAGDRPSNVECSGCGSQEVVVEQLPPDGVACEVEP